MAAIGAFLMKILGMILPGVIHEIFTISAQPTKMCPDPAPILATYEPYGRVSDADLLRRYGGLSTR